MTQRAFPLGVILSCVAFYKVNNNLPIMVNDSTLVNFIMFMDRRTDDKSQLELLTSRPSLMLGAAICGQAVIKQHPGLDEVIYPHETVSSRYYLPWIQGLYLRFGEELTVTSQEDLVLSDEDRRKVEDAHRALIERQPH